MFIYIYIYAEYIRRYFAVHRLSKINTRAVSTNVLYFMYSKRDLSNLISALHLQYFLTQIKLIIKKTCAEENECIPVTDKTDICPELHHTLSQAGTLFNSLKLSDIRERVTNVVFKIYQKFLNRYHGNFFITFQPLNCTKNNTLFLTAHNATK